MEDKARKLSETLGVPVVADYSTLRGGGYTGRMVVPLEWLEEIAAIPRSKKGA